MSVRSLWIIRAVCIHLSKLQVLISRFAPGFEGNYSEYYAGSVYRGKASFDLLGSFAKGKRRKYGRKEGGKKKYCMMGGVCDVCEQLRGGGGEAKGTYRSCDCAKP